MKALINKYLAILVSFIGVQFSAYAAHPRLAGVGNDEDVVYDVEVNRSQNTNVNVDHFTRIFLVGEDGVAHNDLAVKSKAFPENLRVAVKNVLKTGDELSSRSADILNKGVLDQSEALAEVKKVKEVMLSYENELMKIKEYLVSHKMKLIGIKFNDGQYVEDILTPEIIDKSLAISKLNREHLIEDMSRYIVDGDYSDRARAALQMKMMVFISTTLMPKYGEFAVLQSKGIDLFNEKFPEEKNRKK